jgi:hypothetical protein
MATPQEIFQRNQAYVGKRGPYFTKLSPQEELAFMQWVQQNKVPFDDSPTADYDMRGFYKGLLGRSPHAFTAANANDGKMHFSDFWKTPFHKSFSAESQFANPDIAPRWNDKNQLVLPDGTVVFDERAEVMARKSKR